MDELTARLPVGVGVHKVSDQAEVVQEAVGGFTSALFEAVIIVLAVSFISLGLRAGLVVASRSRWCWRWCSCSWNTAASPCSGVAGRVDHRPGPAGGRRDDHRGDDDHAAGNGRNQAAGRHVCLHSTAFPMLTGTLVTVAGFVPIGLNASSAGEYTFTLFAVIAVALLVSWVVAVLFAPVLGVHILRPRSNPSPNRGGRPKRSMAACCGACAIAGGPSAARWRCSWPRWWA
jgi:multidrug efflux pump subunit AcrB